MLLIFAWALHRSGLRRPVARRDLGPGLVCFLLTLRILSRFKRRRRRTSIEMETKPKEGGEQCYGCGNRQRRKEAAAATHANVGGNPKRPRLIPERAENVF